MAQKPGLTAKPNGCGDHDHGPECGGDTERAQRCDELPRHDRGQSEGEVADHEDRSEEAGALMDLGERRQPRSAPKKVAPKPTPPTAPPSNRSGRTPVAVATITSAAPTITDTVPTIRVLCAATEPMKSAATAATSGSIEEVAPSTPTLWMPNTAPRMVGPSPMNNAAIIQDPASAGRRPRIGGWPELARGLAAATTRLPRNEALRSPPPAAPRGCRQP
jgi:hypothetical protein